VNRIQGGAIRTRFRFFAAPIDTTNTSKLNESGNRPSVDAHLEFDLRRIMRASDRTNSSLGIGIGGVGLFAGVMRFHLVMGPSASLT
jgi:hypothetical protein